MSKTEEIDRLNLPFIPDVQLTFLRDKAKMMYETTDKALLFAFGGSILETSLNDFGHDRFFADLILEPEFVHHWFMKLSENHMVNLERVLNAIGEYIQIIVFGDDLGTQKAPQISPSTYREMIKPYHQVQFRYVRENYPNVKVFLHSCGSICDLIPDLIDAGVEILNPVQISALGMDPQKLKNEYGRDVVFWGGGANMQHTAVSGSLREIQGEVSRLIDIFSEAGGYVFNQVHNIQAGVSPEKIMAIYETALSYRK